MEKKGQVTIFIIIAIVIIIFGVLIYMFYPNIKNNFSSSEDEISLFVQTCIEETGKDAIHYVSLKGGYFNSPEFSNLDGIAYYYFEGKNKMPSKKIVEEELSNYMNDLLSFCIQDFENFPEYEINSEDVKTKTRIREGEIIFDVKYPLTIRKGETVTRIEDFENIKVSARLNLIYDSIESIIKDQLTREDICLSCISEIVSRNELKIDINNLEDGIVFEVIDENSYIKNIPLEFRFANKY